MENTKKNLVLLGKIQGEKFDSKKIIWEGESIVIENQAGKTDE